MVRESRRKALEWWNKLDSIKQIEVANEWHKNLLNDAMFKNWTYSMIAASSSCIEEIYRFNHL